MFRYEKIKNRYYEMIAHALKIFSTYCHDEFQKEKMTRPYHFKKFDFPKGIPFQKSNFLKR